MSFVSYLRLVLVALFFTVNLYFASLLVLSAYYEHYIEITMSAQPERPMDVSLDYRHERTKLTWWFSLVAVCIWLVGGRFYLLLGKSGPVAISGNNFVRMVLVLQAAVFIPLAIYYIVIAKQFLNHVHAD